MDLLDVVGGVWYFLHLVCVLMWPVAVPVGIFFVWHRVRVIHGRKKHLLPSSVVAVGTSTIEEPARCEPNQQHHSDLEKTVA